jgi:regulator of ribonuclease activity A
VPVPFATADLSDAHPEALVADPIFRDFGGTSAFRGPIATVRCFEDNSLVWAAVEEPGEGRVLVVDGGGSLACALLGDRLAALARDNGWAGVVVNGCVRDVADLAKIEIGIKALTAHPRRSVKRGAGDRDVEVTFAGVAFVPGSWLYADPDGIVLLARSVDETGAGSQVGSAPT